MYRNNQNKEEKLLCTSVSALGLQAFSPSSCFAAITDFDNFSEFLTKTIIIQKQNYLRNQGANGELLC